MNDIEKAIDAFFACEGDTYVNDNGVEIALLKGAVCVTALWPEEQVDKNVSLAIMKMNESFIEFALNFGLEVNVKEAIEKINVATLLNLYLAGTCTICCSIEGVHATPGLDFYKQDNRIVAKDDAENQHEVTEELKTPRDFIDYTRKYFELNEHMTGFAKYKNPAWKLASAIN